MEAHWIFCEPRDDFNAELNRQKKCECIISKLKKKRYEVLQKVRSCNYIAIRGQCCFRMISSFKQRIASVSQNGA